MPTTQHTDDITLGASVVTLLPGRTNRKSAFIQCRGTGVARVTIDGTDPDATRGFELLAGAWLVIEQPYCPTNAVLALKISGQPIMSVQETF